MFLLLEIVEYYYENYEKFQFVLWEIVSRVKIEHK